MKIINAELVIPLPPITKKNSQRIVYNKRLKRPMILPSEQYKKYEKACEEFIGIWETPIEGPVNVKCVYYMPTRRRVDLTNLLESTSDILVHCGVLEDDNCRIIQSHDGSRVMYCKEQPRTEIEIVSVEGEKSWEKTGKEAE